MVKGIPPINNNDDQALNTSDDSSGGNNTSPSKIPVLPNDNKQTNNDSSQDFDSAKEEAIEELANELDEAEDDLGGFGGFGGFGSGFGSSPSGSRSLSPGGFGRGNPSSAGSKKPMTREERTKMIKKVYKRILGREAQIRILIIISMGLRMKIRLQCSF